MFHSCFIHLTLAIDLAACAVVILALDVDSGANLTGGWPQSGYDGFDDIADDIDIMSI